MRQALVDFRYSQEAGDGGPGIVAGDGAGEDAGETPEDRAAVLEEENRELRETVEAQAEELAMLRRQVAELEEPAQQRGGSDPIDGGQGPPGEWRPPRLGPGMPDAGAVSLEEEPDEAHAFGPAAPLVAEWRGIRAGMVGGAAGSRVDRAVAAMRRWELEVEMLEEFRLTLPPDTEPVDESRRQDQVRWREEARRELAKAERVRLLRRVATLGVWR